jgi:hypothetical protein
MRCAISSVISSFSRTITSSLMTSMIVSRATRPRMPLARLTAIFSPLYTTDFVTPFGVPQSSIVITTFCATSVSLRVR